MFGGLSYEESQDKALPNNQVYSLSIKKQMATWNLMECQGDYPLPRCYHSACNIGSSQNEMIFIFGGMWSSRARFNDSYFLKIRTNPTLTLSHASLIL